jgi:hypothetical protein
VPTRTSSRSSASKALVSEPGKARHVPTRECSELGVAQVCNSLVVLGLVLCGGVLKVALQDMDGQSAH